MQVLLGIARGAWLLTPEWVTASAAAGRWLDESGYEAEVPIFTVLLPLCCYLHVTNRSYVQS